MQTNELSSHLLRRLADLRPDGARVLSLFVNLDPSEFATPSARATEVRSLIDRAERQLRESDGLSHDEQQGLRGDIERAREFFRDFSAEGAHGLAVFVCEAADLFEAIKLPRPVESRAVIDDSPFVEPLAELAMRGSWCVLLVNRQTARMLRGSRERLDELPPVEDDVHRRHDQGGLSQARYQRSVDKEVQDHLKRTADVVFRRFKRAPFERILLGGPDEILPDVEEHLHPYVRERVAGRVKVDVENTTAEAVREATAPVMDEVDRAREREALDRLAEGVGAGGRGVAGLEDTLTALNERRVEILLLAEGYSASGVFCRRCGWVGADGVSACPADGGEIERRDDVIESAIELAILQSADVLVSRDHRDELRERGSIGAVLRF
ncbi:MAG: peptide chain release factor subunit 1 [Thermoleophilaceae bacterium]|jgi:peptide subunit release factor 1 (eRF1)|nr:peptide chain release factor subunit 1 [Thermoleophilaceae bacterium]